VARGQDCVGNSHSTRPDILIRRGDQVACVIDTKWKRFADGIAQSDVYQMIAYARLYHCERLVLLYPAIPGEVATDLHRKGLTQGPERLDISSIALNQSGPDVQQALRRLVVRLIKAPALSGTPAQL
jgi:5-methylcytosine-specific restriction enzyme subunit McrC